MDGQTLVYLLPYLISLAISIGVGVVCWRRRSEVAATGYAAVALVQASWTLGYVCELLSSSLAGKIVWDNIQFISFGGSIIAILAFTLDYTGRRPARPARTYAALAAPFIVIVLLAFTDPLHGWIRGHTRLMPAEPFAALLYDFTPSLWIVSLYFYGLYLFCLVMLLAKIMSAHSLYRAQAILVFLGLLVPALGGVLTLTVFSDSPYRDITPFTFAIGNLIVAWGLFRYQLFDVMPVAREAVFDSISDTVYVLDARGRLVDLNPAASQALGRTQAEVIGQPVSAVFSAWPELVARYEHSEQEHIEVEAEVAGEQRYLDLRVQPLHDRRGRFLGRVVVSQNITARKQAEAELRRHRDHLEELVRERTAELSASNAQLRSEIAERQRFEAQFLQAQKMEAVGRLAGGIAHDFNNLLTAIIGYAELLLDGSTVEEIQPDVQQILHAANQAAALTRQLLAFSRKQVLQAQVVDLNSVVKELEPLIRRLIGEDIELVTFTRPEIGYVHADPAQLQQVIMNLVVNARDAMPRGGRLTIETAKLIVDGVETERPAAVPQGSYVLLVVHDTGMGMDQTVQQHLFEPFFTTKERGKGTGLGLATVHGIVSQSGGAIDVSSTPGHGATFTIYLPWIEQASDAPRAGAQRAKAARGTETIVLVEDEATVRGLLQRILKQSGYTVLAAAHAREAIQVCEQYGAPIDLLVTDVVMPGGMSGRDLAERLAKSHQLTRVLYISGYLDDMIVYHDSLDLRVNFIQKPFTPDTLTRKVREVLDSARPTQGSPQ